MRKRSDDLSLETQRSLHSKHARHRSWLFLPWHRIELYCFERIVAAITGHDTFALPYWDFQKTPNLPRMFFDPADPLFVAGRRAAASTDFAEQRRRFDPRIADILTSTPEEFFGTKNAAGRLEALPHNILHVLVGGAMGDLNTAPLDPLFFLHHANIDYAWWMRGNNTALPSGWLESKLTGFVNPDGSRFTARVSDAIDPFQLGYAYDEPKRISGMGHGRYDHKVSSRVFHLKGARIADDRLEIVLPAELLRIARQRRGGTEIVMTGTGKVAFADVPTGTRLMVIATGRSTSGRRSLETGSCIALGHSGELGNDEMSECGYPFIFPVREELASLVADTDGPITIKTAAETFEGMPIKAPATELTLDVTVNRMHLDPEDA